MRRLRLWFWMGVHDALERAWHWVYRHKVVPALPPIPKPEPIIYSKVFENNEVTIYRY